MAQKFRSIESGVEVLKEATVTSAGAADAGEIVALDGAGRLSLTVMPEGIGPDTKTLVATEALSAGDYVNIYNDAGTAKCRLADNSNGRPAHGFVKSAVSMSSNALVYFEGANNGLTGLTPGARQYLGVAGAPTETPVTSGTHQFLGIAISATEINTDIEEPVTIL